LAFKLSNNKHIISDWVSFADFSWRSKRIIAVFSILLAVSMASSFFLAFSYACDYPWDRQGCGIRNYVLQTHHFLPLFMGALESLTPAPLTWAVEVVLLYALSMLLVNRMSFLRPRLPTIAMFGIFFALIYVLSFQRPDQNQGFLGEPPSCDQYFLYRLCSGALALGPIAYIVRLNWVTAGFVSYLFSCTVFWAYSGIRRRNAYPNRL